ncbi:MAG: ExeM/NucH family extracellular endonuclease [Nocardioides sp.]
MLRLSRSSRPARRSHALLAVVASGALVFAGGALLGPAHANPAGTGLVISEVYGAGGNSGATYNADYVELFNPTDAAISVVGDYIHYRSAGGSSGGTPAALTGSVPAHGHYLIQMGAASATNGVALPTPDAGPFGFSLAAAGGQVFLLNTPDPITTSGDMKGVAGVVDMVGATSSSTSFETKPTTGAATTANSLQRTATGADTDDNSVDFSALPADPQDSGGGTPPPPPSEHTIAEIQGTGATSPLVGDSVITQGVVTAAYPTGGFFGYVIQTDGTGSGADATPGASDAVFVHQPSGSVTVQVGDYVQVTGKVSEFSGLTELSVDSADVEQLGAPPLGGVTPLSLAYPTTDDAREAHESELIAPTDEFTVTDNYSTNQYGEIGLATGDHQLVQPTDVYPAGDSADIAQVEADNAARLVTLNDGSSWNFLTTDKNTPMPWLTPDNPVRIGSTATLQQPMILDYRNGLWELQPTSQVTGDGHQWATFSDTRTPNQAPRAVGGDLRLATFNVENFFPTSAADYEAQVGDPDACSAYTDRDGNPIDVNECAPNGPRGAWDSTNLQRQLVKETSAINTMNADVMSLEEIENSVQFGKDRDDALSKLVDALNAAAGTTRWAYVPSPDPADLPPTAEQDVIRTAFIYNPAKVEPVGAPVVLSDQSDPGEPFANAREPLAQEFKRKGALDSDGFLVIVNHLKSKGDSTPPATGDNANGLQGAFNGDRVRQAHALVDFANQVSAARGTNRVFLVGDFNSYTQEDPMQVLYQAGYVNQPSDDPKDVSYEFDGLAGSLDHVLASPAAAKMVTGRDVWQINAEESVGFEYSRYNYNATLLYQPNQFRASDHNPELVGLSAPYSQEQAKVTVTATPNRVQRKKDRSRIDVTVSAAQATPTGWVAILVGNQQLALLPLVDGHASLTTGTFPNAGTQIVGALYLGDKVTKPAVGATTLTVTK